MKKKLIGTGILLATITGATATGLAVKNTQPAQEPQMEVREPVNEIQAQNTQELSQPQRGENSVGHSRSAETINPERAAEPTTSTPLDFGNNQMHELRLASLSNHKFYAEPAGDQFRIFTYFGTESTAIYISADTGRPLLDKTEMIKEESHFNEGTLEKAKEILKKFEDLFAPDTWYKLQLEEGSYITGIKKTNNIVTFKNVIPQDQLNEATKFNGETLKPLQSYPTRERRSISGRIAWSGNVKADRQFVRKTKRFRKRRINVNNPRYQNYVFSLNIKGTIYHLELVSEGYRIFIYDNGVQYLNPKTGEITSDNSEQTFKKGSVFEMYQIAKKYRENK